MSALVMGVLNVTPDSFSDGGRYLDPVEAIAHGRALIAEGADVVDVGGESTRPGAVPVPVDEERRRVLPVVEALAGEIRVSVDTRKPAVATAAVAAGATLVNDVSGSLELARIAAEAGAGWVCMHMKGEPRTMQQAPHYDDVVGEVRGFLEERANAGRALGVGEVWIDPGIGFGKTRAHNATLLAHLDQLVATGWPVLVGTSRKSFLGAWTGEADAEISGGSEDRAGGAGAARGGWPGLSGADVEPTPVEDRIEASVATATWALLAGAGMVRVHDVGAIRGVADTMAGLPVGAQRW